MDTNMIDTCELGRTSSKKSDSGKNVSKKSVERRLDSPLVHEVAAIKNTSDRYSCDVFIDEGGSVVKFHCSFTIMMKHVVE